MKSNGINLVYSSDKGFDAVPWVKRVFEGLTREAGFREFLEELRLREIRVELKEKDVDGF